jgi:hypothetical protein
LNFGDSFTGAGVLLNTHVENNKLYVYALKVGSGRNLNWVVGYLYKLAGIPTGSSYIYSDTIWQPGKLVDKISIGNSGSYLIQTTKKNISVTKNGTLLKIVNIPTRLNSLVL